jgi:hypothetical protein
MKSMGQRGWGGQNCFVQNFGHDNADNVYFVIRQAGKGRGLFSLLSAVICYLEFADRCGFIPAIDFENFHTEYNEICDIAGTKNAFEYYFLPVSHASLDTIYSSKRVIFSENSYPKNYDFNVTAIPNLKNIFDKYIRVRPEIEKLVFIKKDSKDRVLGVHFRGQEMRTAKGHSFPPTKKQILSSIDMIMKKEVFQYIFICTEDQRLLEFIKKEYGPIVLCNDHFRTTGDNAYQKSPRQNHKYLLGREILVDMLCLSRCHSLIYGDSNVTEMARFINNDNYKKTIFIDNGMNSRFQPIASVLWGLKNILPPMLGGFRLSHKSIIYKENTYE